MTANVEKFLASYRPEVRDLALSLRRLVLDVIPDAMEQIDVPAKIIGYGFGPRYADVVCVIMPLKDAVNLGLARGTELPDPKKLLEGTGKRARHVKIRTAEDIKAHALRALVKAAVAAMKR